jgi:hypothetical protein
LIDTGCESYTVSCALCESSHNTIFPLSRAPGSYQDLY